MQKYFHHAVLLTALSMPAALPAVASGAQESTDSPVTELDDYLTDSPVISADIMNADRLPSSRSLQRKGPTTYTYVRCITRSNKKQSDPHSEIFWAKNDAGNGYYRLNGYWYAAGPLKWKNMFYTTATYTDLENVCKKTLTAAGKSVNDLLIYAADNRFSFDHTIWSLSVDDKAMKKNGAFERIITFGDSLSDTSNVFNASEWQMPNRKAWYHGHFSNGYVWHEHLAQMLGIHSYNWAVGSATTNNHPIAGIINVPGIDSQIDSFTAYIKDDPNYKISRSLFSIMVGGNDLIDGGISVKDMTANISQGVQRLIDMGAKNIIVMTPPDVSLIPDMQSKTSSQKLTLKNNVNMLNAGIKQLVQQKSAMNSDVDIYLIDVAKTFNDMVNNPQNYGIADTKNACLNVMPGTLLPAYLFPFSPTDSCTSGKVHLFWDRVHPTSLIHKKIAAQIMAALVQHYRLTVAPPDPATVTQ